MIINNLIEDSFLSKACKEVRNILTANDFIKSLFKDELRPDDPIIGNMPLNAKTLYKDHLCSVYHLCKENITNYDNGLTYMEGFIYIDISRKIAPKDDLILYDELDKLAWTILEVLYSHADNLSLNGTVNAWKFINKQLWGVNPDKDNKSPNSLLDYICEITLSCEYTASHYQYYSN